MIDEKKPFFSHLKELRDRLVVCVIAVGIAFIISYTFKERIFAFLMQPFVQVMPAGSSRSSCPWGPLTLTELPLRVMVTLEGTGIGERPIRDIRPHPIWCSSVLSTFHYQT